MPFYDYACKKCNAEFETFHTIADTTSQKCPNCGSVRTRKMVSACTFTVRNTGRRVRVMDGFKKEQDARADLAQNHGVENVTPLRGQSVLDVYNDVKGRGHSVRDQMQKEREVNAAKSLVKRREWARKANQRVEKRTMEAKERKAKEKAAKEAIRL